MGWRPKRCWWQHRMHVGVVSSDITYIDTCLICLMLGVWCDWWLHNYDVVNLLCWLIMLKLNYLSIWIIWSYLIYTYFQLFMLIMIDVKLTPSGLWPLTCLYEWVDGVQEWSFSCLVSCLRIAGASSVYLLESYIRLWVSVFTLLCWNYSIVEILPICRVLEILFGVICWFMTVGTNGVLQVTYWVLTITRYQK